MSRMGLRLSLIIFRLLTSFLYVTGFEAGGPNTPSNIDPWLIIGDESNIIVATDRSSCFAGNPIALRMEVHCETSGTNACPSGGVGFYNPGYWGMVRPLCI